MAQAAVRNTEYNICIACGQVKSITGQQTLTHYTFSLIYYHGAIRSGHYLHIWETERMQQSVRSENISYISLSARCLNIHSYILFKYCNIKDGCLGGAAI